MANQKYHVNYKRKLPVLGKKHANFNIYILLPHDNSAFPSLLITKSLILLKSTSSINCTTGPRYQISPLLSIASPDSLSAYSSTAKGQSEKYQSRPEKWDYKIKAVPPYGPFSQIHPNSEHLGVYLAAGLMPSSQGQITFGCEKCQRSSDNLITE